MKFWEIWMFILLKKLKLIVDSNEAVKYHDERNFDYLFLFTMKQMLLKRRKYTGFWVYYKIAEEFAIRAIVKS